MLSFPLLSFSFSESAAAVPSSEFPCPELESSVLFSSVLSLLSAAGLLPLLSSLLPSPFDSPFTEESPVSCISSVLSSGFSPSGISS